MPGYGIKQVTYDSPRADTAMKRMANRIENLEGVGPAVHEIMQRHIYRTFNSEGSNIGESWPGYTGSESTYGDIKQLLLGSKRGKMLLRWEKGRERLFPSLVNPRHPEHVWKMEGKSFVFGTSVPYAYKHQHGVGTGPEWADFPKIKRRTFLSSNRIVTAEIRRAYLDFIGLGEDNAIPLR